MAGMPLLLRASTSRPDGLPPGAVCAVANGAPRPCGPQCIPSRLDHAAVAASPAVQRPMACLMADFAPTAPSHGALRCRAPVCRASQAYACHIRRLFERMVRQCTPMGHAMCAYPEIRHARAEMPPVHAILAREPRNTLPPGPPSNGVRRPAAPGLDYTGAPCILPHPPFDRNRSMPIVRTPTGARTPSHLWRPPPRPTPPSISRQLSSDMIKTYLYRILIYRTDLPDRPHRWHPALACRTRNAKRCRLHVGGSKAVEPAKERARGHAKAPPRAPHTACPNGRAAAYARGPSEAGLDTGLAGIGPGPDVFEARRNPDGFCEGCIGGAAFNEESNTALCARPLRFVPPCGQKMPIAACTRHCAPDGMPILGAARLSARSACRASRKNRAGRCGELPIRARGGLGWRPSLIRTTCPRRGVILAAAARRTGCGARDSVWRYSKA